MSARLPGSAQGTRRRAQRALTGPKPTREPARRSRCRRGRRHTYRRSRLMWTVLKALALRLAVGRTLGGMLATLFLFLVPLAGVLKVVGLPILIVLGVIGAPVFLLLAAIGLPVLV